MKNGFAAAFAIGLGVIALAVGGIVYMQRGDKIELPGKILKVRTAPLDADSSIAVLDFRITNPSDVQFEVRTVTVEMADAGGKSYMGQPTSETDAKSLFDGLPVLGQKYNNTLVMRERISAHASRDRMIAVRFQAPVSILEARKRLVLRIEEVDGKTFEFSER